MCLNRCNMGGRGSFLRSGGRGIPVEDREYSTIGTLGRIKIVQWDKGTNNKTPPYSNTPNTTYYAYSKERKRIEKIYYFRNHKLYKCVEFDIDKNRPHVHYWRNGVEVGRDRHDSKNIFPLNERDIRLYKQAMRWNQERKGKS